HRRRDQRGRDQPRRRRANGRDVRLRLCRTSPDASIVTTAKSDTSACLSAPSQCASVLIHMAQSGDQGAWKALAELSSIGFALVIATVIGLVGGYWLDRWLGTAPWLMLIGLGFGIAAGFVNLFRSVKRAERELDDS